VNDPRNPAPGTIYRLVREVVSSTTYPETVFELKRPLLDDDYLVLQTVTRNRVNSVCPHGTKTALVQTKIIPFSALVKAASVGKLQDFTRSCIESLIRQGEEHEVDEGLKFDGVPVRWPHDDGTANAVTYEEAVRRHRTEGRCTACYEAEHVYGRGPAKELTGLQSVLTGPLRPLEPGKRRQARLTPWDPS